jgi:nucleoid-associated protein YgaU
MARRGHPVHRCAADVFDVVAIATAARPYGGWGDKAVAPAGLSALRRAVGTLHEPNAWTAGILIATGVALIARHPIAGVIGTEVDTPAAPTSVATAPATTVPVTHVPTVGAPLVTVATHAPRNPFAALIKGPAAAPSGSGVTANATVTPHTLTPITTTPKSVAAQATDGSTGSTAPVSAPASGGSCNGTMHRVVRGDTLWSLAATAVHSNGVGKVTIAWHKLYDANRDAIGSNPSLLRVGTDVCVPTNL